MFCAFDDTVICNKEHNFSMVAPSSQDEGDTRVFVRVQYMVRTGHTVVKLRTIETDVIAIGLAMFQLISGVQEL